MTLEAWGALPDDDPGEWVDGVVIDEEQASFVHENVVTWLIALLVAWGHSRRVRVAGSDARLGIAQKRGRKADVTVWFPEDRRPPATGLIRVPPTIAIEVVTPTPRDERRDRVEKLREYAAFGVRFYWIVDPELRTFQIHELGPDGTYVHRVDATEGRVTDVPGCAGLTIDVDGLWRHVDEILAESGEGDA